MWCTHIFALKKIGWHQDFAAFYAHKSTHSPSAPVKKKNYKQVLGQLASNRQCRWELHTFSNKQDLDSRRSNWRVPHILCFSLEKIKIVCKLHEWEESFHTTRTKRVFVAYLYLFKHVTFALKFFIWSTLCHWQVDLNPSCIWIESTLHPWFYHVNPYKLTYRQLYISDTYTNFTHSNAQTYLPSIILKVCY